MLVMIELFILLLLIDSVFSNQKYIINSNLIELELNIYIYIYIGHKTEIPKKLEIIDKNSLLFCLY